MRDEHERGGRVEAAARAGGERLPALPRPYASAIGLAGLKEDVMLEKLQRLQHNIAQLWHSPVRASGCVGQLFELLGRVGDVEAFISAVAPRFAGEGGEEGGDEPAGV